MEITIRKHRRNLSYDDAATLDEFWVLAERFDRSLYREWKDHWDERGYDEYIVVTEGRLPYCESPAGKSWRCWPSVPRNSGSVFCFMLCTISAMRKSERFAVAPKAQSKRLLMLSEKFFKNFGNRHIR